jgi:UDPglucose 6-dehydrogenase
LGQAIERFCNPPLRVIGSDNERALDRLEALFSVIGDKWERVSLRTAEMVKHALNGYLALSLTFGNELGNLCDKVGADGRRIAEILRREPRVGAKAMLFPGLGFSGGTLARDMQTLINLGRRSGVETPLLNGAWQSNTIQNKIVTSKLRQVFSTSGCARGAKSLANRKITVLGLAYKPETSTLRRSISLAIIGELVREKALVTAHDPRADRTEIARHHEFRFEEDVYQAVRGADALLLITGWKEYKNLDYGKIRKLMAGNLLIDANNILNKADLEQFGFRYIGIGRGFDSAPKKAK